MHDRTVAAEPPEMDTLKDVLAEIIDTAEFDVLFGDLHRTVTDEDGKLLHPKNRRVSAAELRDIRQAVGRPVRVRIPDASMSRLVDALRSVLGKFIDPETDRIGHAFPIDGANYTRSTIQKDGLYDQEAVSSVKAFANAYVQSAAIIGVEKVIGLLAGWRCGERVQLQMSTVLNGLFLSDPVSLRKDIRVVPLPLTTADLPRLPSGLRGHHLQDYLGLSLLTVRLFASPALFRPDPGAGEQRVQSRSDDDVDLDLVCEALSLHVDCHVSRSFVWHDYPDAAAFHLGTPETWSQPGNRLEPIKPKKIHRDLRTGVVMITPPGDVSPQHLDADQVRRTFDALGGADRKLRIAVNRWRRSKHPHARLEDRYIDLRIALESLYLKDFINEHSQEMRFRLPLFGAWHLSRGLEERRSIRKTLRDAYDTASQAVHEGEIRARAKAMSRPSEALLPKAQDLCRCGILKLLHEGAPRDWVDLILGADVSSR